MNSTLKSSGKNWYKEIWSLDIKNQSWVENTVDEVAFIIKTLKLNGKEKILDMALWLWKTFVGICPKRV